MANDEEGLSESPITGINVTPLVDVALVLLIVFLVSAQLLAARVIPLEVPRSAPPSAVQTTLAVAIDAAGAVTVDGRAMSGGDALLRAASEAKKRDPDVKAVIQAAPTTSHGAVVAAIDALRRADVTKITFAR
jgi:biopolymer transport protein TolR